MNGRNARVFEQYLMHILKELRPPANIETQSDVELYTQGM